MTYPVVWSGLVGSPKRFEIGLQLTRQDVAVAGQSTVRVEWAVFVRSPYAISEVGDLYWSVGHSGGWQVNGSSAPAVAVNNTTMQIGTIGVDLPITSRTPLDWWLWAGLDGIAAAGVGNVAELDIDGYAWFAPPPVPTGVTAARVSDYRVDLSWTLPQNNAARVENVVISRWDAKTGGTKTIKTLGYATSYQDRTTEPNNRYLYSIQAKNRSATGGTGSSGYVSTKPAPPGSVAAGRTVSGDVQVTWVNLARTPGTVEVWDNPNGNYANTTKIGEVAWPGTSWTGTASTLQTHVYYLKHRTSDTPILTSSDSPNSNTVALPSPPLSPSGIGPAVMDPADLTPITWIHNSSDTTGQKACEVQYRQVGASTWISTGKITSTVSSWTTPGTWPTGVSMEVQVRTWGVHATAGPWSATALVKIDGKPSATISSPTGTINASSVTVQLAYYDPESTAQSAGEVQLVDAGGAVLETVAIDGPGTSAPLTTRLADGASYEIRARVRDGAGLWSQTATSTITVDYLEPPTPSATASWVTADASVTIIMTHVPVGAGQVAAAVYEVVRDGAVVWTGLAPEPGAPVTITDPIPPVAGVEYRIVAWSALPSSAELVIPLPGVPYVRARAWWNAGPGWSVVAAMGAAVQRSHDLEIAALSEHYAGRDKPVVTFGTAESEKFSVSGRMHPAAGEDPDVLGEIVRAGTVVCYRDKWSRQFVHVGGYSENRGAGAGAAAVTVPMTVVDYTEGML